MLINMSLSVDFRFAGGSVAAVRVCESESCTEVQFAADPCGGSKALWFDFRVIESSPDVPHPENITITLRFIRTMPGCDSPSGLLPVHRGEGQGWNRTRAGKLLTDDDGQPCVSWTIPYPAPASEFALCYPYGRHELKSLVRKSKDYWKTTDIGLSEKGHLMQRVSNSVARAEARPGIFLIARQYAGETPGSWVLDGILQHFSRTHESRVLVWSVPFADGEGIERGRYGRGSFADDLGHCWGTPPLRHETRVIQADLAEWRTRCQPAVVLDLQATGGSDSQGIHCRLPVGKEACPAVRDSERWANVLCEALGAEYVDEDFKRDAGQATGAMGQSLGDYVRESLAVSALTLATPYALCGKTVMTPKQYREVGRRIGRAVVQRVLTGSARK